MCSSIQAVSKLCLSILERLRKEERHLYFICITRPAKGTIAESEIKCTYIIQFSCNKTLNTLRILEHSLEFAYWHLQSKKNSLYCINYNVSVPLQVIQ